MGMSETLKKKKLVAIGGDIFAGTFTLGIKQAGFEVPLHLAHCNYGNATAKKNFPDLEIRTGVNNWDLATIGHKKLDLMFCNPPCAVWSNANTKNSSVKDGWKSDARLNWIFDLAEAGQELKPKTWVWESVVPAWDRGREFVLSIANSWIDLGYSFTILLQNNMFLGAPQDRKRMFAIAHKHPLVWPELRPRDEVFDVGDLLKQVPKAKPSELKPHILDAKWADLWDNSTRFGGSLRRAGQNTGFSFLIKRLDPDKPPGVMMTYEHKLHPTQPRYLTWQEWLLFHGLPPDWQTACGSITTATSELSRAVLTPVGCWLGTAIKEGLSRPPLRTPVIRFVDLRDPEHPRNEIINELRGESMKRAVPEQPEEKKTPKVGSKVRTVATAGPSRPGSGVRIRELLLEDRHTTDGILEIIHKEFPQSKAKASDISWNRAKLRHLQEST